MGAALAEVGQPSTPCCSTVGVPGYATGGGGGGGGLRREGGGGGVRSADSRLDVGGDLVLGDLVVGDLTAEGAVLVAVVAFKGMSQGLQGAYCEHARINGKVRHPEGCERACMS